MISLDDALKMCDNTKVIRVSLHHTFPTPEKNNNVKRHTVYNSLTFPETDSCPRGSPTNISVPAEINHNVLSLTLSLLRVIDVKIPLQPHQKYNITQYGELDFSQLTQMKSDYTTNSRYITHTIASRIPRTNTVNRHLCGAGLADASLAHLLRIVGRYTASHSTTAALHFMTDDKQLEKYYAYQ